MQKKWYESSAGQGLSLTIKGALIGAIPIIIFGAQLLGFELDQSTTAQYIEFIANWVALTIILAGAVRKAYYIIKDKFFKK